MAKITQKFERLGVQWSKGLTGNWDELVSCCQTDVLRLLSIRKPKSAAAPAVTDV